MITCTCQLHLSSLVTEYCVNDNLHFPALQQETGQTLSEMLTFNLTDSIQCFSFVTVDDNVGLEETEFLTLVLRHIDSSSQRFSFGLYNRTSIGILDDDGKCIGGLYLLHYI